MKQKVQQLFAQLRKEFGLGSEVMWWYEEKLCHLLSLIEKGGDVRDSLIETLFSLTGEASVAGWDGEYTMKKITLGHLVCMVAHNVSMGKGIDGELTWLENRLRQDIPVAYCL